MDGGGGGVRERKKGRETEEREGERGERGYEEKGEQGKTREGREKGDGEEKRGRETPCIPHLLMRFRFFRRNVVFFS